MVATSDFPKSPSVASAIESLLADLDLDAAGHVRAAAAVALARKLDEAATETGARGAQGLAQLSRELRATLAELTAGKPGSDLLSDLFGGDDD